MTDETSNIPPQQPYEPVPPTPNYDAVPPPPQSIPPAQAGGLSDSAAGAIAYLTFIPAVIFLIMEPYKNKAFIRFHCIQELGLTVLGMILNVLFHFLIFVPFLGFLFAAFVWIALFIVWLLCILKASQGGTFKLPVIGDFAAKQSGYTV